MPGLGTHNAHRSSVCQQAGSAFVPVNAQQAAARFCSMRMVSAVRFQPRGTLNNVAVMPVIHYLQDQACGGWPPQITARKMTQNTASEGAHFRTRNSSPNCTLCGSGASHPNNPASLQQTEPRYPGRDSIILPPAAHAPVRDRIKIGRREFWRHRLIGVDEDRIRFVPVDNQSPSIATMQSERRRIVGRMIRRRQETGTRCARPRTAIATHARRRMSP